MKPSFRHLLPSVARGKGFTLLEVILIFVIGGILAAMIAPYLRASVRSVNPVTDLEKTCTAYTTMELINADYRSRYRTAQANGTAVNLRALQTAIGSGKRSNSYGSYTVVENKFIKFTAGREQNTSATHFLKVSIADPTGTTFTTIFADQ